VLHITSYHTLKKIETRTENHQLEFKDFRSISDSKAELKLIKTKLFTEISAMSNSDGGQIIIGVDDNTFEYFPQPDHILKLLIKETLSQFINDFSDNLIILDSNEIDGIVTIDVAKGTALVSASKDAKKLFKGEIYYRENTESKKANRKVIAGLVKKFSSIPIEKKIEKLKKVVKRKFEEGKNNASEMNIYDSMAISVTNSKQCAIPEMQTMFDRLMYNQFILSYNLPISSHISMQMHTDLIDNSLFNNNLDGGAHLEKKQRLIDTLKKKPEHIISLLKGWRDDVYNSKGFDNYLAMFDIE
jgi:hypothetical protein